MTFARVNPAGWLHGEQLMPDQVNQLDVNVSRALDGHGGGRYTPRAHIDLLGTVPLATTIEDLQINRAMVSPGPLVLATMFTPHGICYRMTWWDMRDGDVKEIGVNSDIHYVTIVGPSPGVHVHLLLSRDNPHPFPNEVIHIAACSIAVGGDFVHIYDAIDPLNWIHRFVTPPVISPMQNVQCSRFMWDGSEWVMTRRRWI